MIDILIVEDEKPISDLLRLNLTAAGYRCTTAFDGHEAEDILSERDFDLVLLDVMLPGIDGFSLMDYCRELKLPVIFLTAKASLDDKVRGLNSGAEDYIVKPFEVIELLARIRIVLRRHHKTDERITIGGLTIDTENQVAQRDGQTLPLTPKEFELLVLLARNKGITLYREKIYEEIWGEEPEMGSRTLDLHIQRLRKKTGLGGSIRTIYGTGYRLETSE